MSRREDVTSSTFTWDNHRTTPVCQAISSSGSELARLWQAQEGCVSPMADRRGRESSPMASCYLLSNTQALTCRRVTWARPGMRLATSPVKTRGYNTGSRRYASHEGRNRVSNGDRGRLAHTRMPERTNGLKNDKHWSLYEFQNVECGNIAKDFALEVTGN